MSQLNPDLSYRQAQEELQNILQSLEDGVVEIDQLESVVRRARDLLIFCEGRLRSIESRLKDVDNED